MFMSGTKEDIDKAVVGIFYPSVYFILYLYLLQTTLILRQQ